MRMRFLILLFLVYPFLVFSQLNDFGSLQLDLEQKLRKKQAVEVIDLVNRRIYSKNAPIPEKERDILRVYKVEALVQSELYQEAEEIAEMLLKDCILPPEFEHRLLVQKALIEEILDNFKKSADALNKSGKILNQHPQLKNKYLTNWLVRKASLRRVQHDTTYLAYINQAIEYGTRNRDYYHTALAYMLKGFFYKRQNERITMDNFKNAMILHKKEGRMDDIAFMHLNMAKLLLHSNLKEAKNHADSALVIARSFPFISLKRMAHQTQSMIFEKNNQPDSALKYFKDFFEYDKQYNLSLKQIKLKELDNKLLREKEIINKKAVEEKNKRLKQSLVGSTFTIVSLSFLLWLLYRSRQRIKIQHAIIIEDTEQLKKLVDDKTFLVKELNHRTKNNLQLVTSLAARETNKTDKKEITGLVNLASKIESIASLHKQLYINEQLKSVNLKPYVEEIITNIRPFLEQNEIEIQQEIEDVEIDSGLSLYIGLVINELIINSIKHAFAGIDKKQIFLSVKNEKEQVEISYADNGTGITEGEKPKLISTLSRQLEAEFLVKNQNGFYYKAKIKV